MQPYRIATHLLRILLAWALATAVGGGFMLLAVFIARLKRESLGELLATVPLFLPLSIYLTALATVLPTAAIIVTGEILSARRWYFYCVGGVLSGVCGVLSPLRISPWGGFRWSWQKASLDQLANWPMILIALGGALSGLVYWAIAGRQAGLRASFGKVAAR